MVDSHSLNNVSGPTSAFNFKSGDISGTAAKTSDEKMGQGGEYFMQYQEDEMMRPDERYVDRSAQLRATLNSLAMMNVANIMKTTKKPKDLNENSEDNENKEEKQQQKSQKQKLEEDYELSPED